MVLVSDMHITAAVYVNDWESGLINDFQVWLEKLAPAGLPYRHHQTGEDNADAHLKGNGPGQCDCQLRLGPEHFSARLPSAPELARLGRSCSQR
jgi:Uncharacterised protein family UPF0047